VTFAKPLGGGVMLEENLEGGKGKFCEVSPVWAALVASALATAKKTKNSLYRSHEERRLRTARKEGRVGRALGGGISGRIGGKKSEL